MNRIARFFQLPVPERHTFLLALVLLPFARLSLGLFGLRRTRRMLRALLPACLCAPVLVHSVEMQSAAASTGRIVRAAAWYGCSGATCLPQAVVAWTLLRRRGIDAVLRIGIRRRHGRMDAHAWVECGGTSIEGRIAGKQPSSAFSPFAPIP